MRRLSDIYDDFVLRRPIAILVIVAACTFYFGWYTQYFSLDASADSLTLERDEGLGYYRYVRARYGSDDFLLVTYTPDQPIFSDGVLSDIELLRNELAALPNIESVTTILDVPLVNSPAADLRFIDRDIRYLEDADTDRLLAQQELLTSPLYKDLLISSDGRTTALRVDMQRDDAYRELREQRDQLREKEFLEGLTAKESVALSEPQPEDNWTGYTGFIHKVLLNEYLANHRAPEDCEYYLCGPPMMNSAVIKMLKDLGVADEDILLDDFGS
ncbi:MAG: hypothetical protein O3A13_15845 [Proteobacteria bacterium]|nr:hypothetical protein [Pseudomonadota bacterium]MDA0995086.1 hypothetical protein [Pseudomonadota bacterium]